MMFIIILCLISLNTVTSKTLLPQYRAYAAFSSGQESASASDSVENQDQMIDLKTMDDKESEEVAMEIDKTLRNNKAVSKKPCAMVVLANNQNQSPLMQSLMRKYRYDARGVLIPSSVKYFMKTHDPQASRAQIVQLNNRSYSPLGGFVRYYKEVPPIPHSL